MSGTKIINLFIKVNGVSIPDEYSVVSFEANFSVNRISSAQIVIMDGEASTGKFKASSSNMFVPGNEISISVGYDSENTEIFKGLITSQNINISVSQGATLEITCRDKTVNTTVGRKSASFFQKKDSEIIKSILKTYSGLNHSVTETTTQWPQMVQYYTTDWDFIVARAEANGLIVTVINEVVSILNPISKMDPVLTLSYGIDIMEFNGDLNSIQQLGNIKASSWDYTTQNMISGTSSNSFYGAGNISSKKLSEVVNLDTFQLQTAAAINQEDLTNWSKAQSIKSELSKFCGQVTCEGTHKVVPGNFIALNSLGDRFNGNHFVSSVTHTIEEGIWLTIIEFGLSPKWFTETTDLMAPSASGLLPGVNGLFTATVKKTDEDPDNQYRILIDIPLFDPNGEGLWARHGSFYASSNAGAFFLPEVGDEVIVGFLNEDPRYPIILGSLYSNNKHKPFEGLEPNKNNTTKAIVSKSGIAVNFDDENQTFTITTPNNNTAIFSDKDQHITIQDQNQNSMVMNAEGIQITSAKNISIQSKQKLSLKGDDGVSIESSVGDVTITALNINQEANLQFSAKGGTTASLKGGADLTLKGALVKIN